MEESWYNNIYKRWKAIDFLVKKRGTHEDEVAWKLCKDDIAKLELENDELKKIFQ